MAKFIAFLGIAVLGIIASTMLGIYIIVNFGGMS